jgi:hypothetical protein
MKREELEPGKRRVRESVVRKTEGRRRRKKEKKII